MTPTSQELLKVLPHIRFEIMSLLLVPEHDTKNDALRESVALRQMVSARLLYSFFTTPKSKRSKDDVLSDDFGFAPEELYKTNAQKLMEEFNKRIFHLTYSRSHGPWQTGVLLPPIKQQSLKFIDWIIAYKGIPITMIERNEWRTLKSNIGANVPLQHQSSNVAAPIIAAPFPTDIQVKLKS